MRKTGVKSGNFSHVYTEMNVNKEAVGLMGGKGILFA